MKFIEKKIESVGLAKALCATCFFVLMIYVIDFSPFGVAGLSKLTGGAGILDFEHGYSVQKAYSMLEALGEQGRNFYLTRILPEDIFFPLSFMLFNFCWMSVLLKKNFSSASRFNLVALLPLVNMLFDWSENIGFTLMLLNYPEQLSVVCKISSCFTHLKFTCVLMIIIVFVLLLGMAAAKKIASFCKNR